MRSPAIPAAAPICAKRSRKMKNQIIPISVLERTCKELYNAGMNLWQISKALNLDSNEVRKYLKDCDLSPTLQRERNEALINEILYEANVPIATSEIVRIEKDRYAKYSEVESKCLSVMLQLLDFYERAESGDIEVDKFKAQLAANFIKATQAARDEIVRKYELETKVGDNTLRIEFVEPLEVNNA